MIPTFFPRIGGAERLVFELANRWAENNEVRLITPIIPGMPEKNEEYCFSVSRFKDHFETLRFSRVPILSLIHKLLPISFSQARALLYETKKFKPDIINIHYTIPTWLAGLIAGKISRNPVVFSFVSRRDIPGPMIPRKWVFYNRLAIRYSAASVFVTKFCYDAVIGNNSNLAKKCEIIPPGIDLTRFNVYNKAEARKKVGLPVENRILFSIQRLAKIKGVDIIIRAFSNIVHQYDDVLLIVGGTGEEAQSLHELALKLGISNKVRFVGFIPDQILPYYYSSADIFLFHSNYETFGITLAEAMASGLPIIAVKSTAVPNVIDNGRTGILVEPKNDQSFAAAIIELLNSEKMRVKLGEEALRVAQREYNASIIAEKYLNLFSRVVEEKKRFNSEEISK